MIQEIEIKHLEASDIEQAPKQQYIHTHTHSRRNKKEDNRDEGK